MLTVSKYLHKNKDSHRIHHKFVYWSELIWSICHRNDAWLRVCTLSSNTLTLIEIDRIIYVYLLFSKNQAKSSLNW